MDKSMDKRKLETVEQTNSHHHEPEVSSQSNNFNQVRSDSQKSTNTQFSENNIFQISVQRLMPLVMKIKEQNEQLSQCKEKMARQMKQLEDISLARMKENEDLRFHYHTRTDDIKKVTNTMTINTNENFSDTKHLISTFKNRNCSLIRNIEKLVEEKKSIEISIPKITTELDEIQEFNLKNEQRLRERLIKLKQVQNKFKKLQSSKENIFDKTAIHLEQDIDSLILENREKKLKNINYIKAIKKISNEVQTQKPQKERQNIQIIKAILHLNMELSIIKEESKREKNKIEEYEKKKDKIMTEFEKTEKEMEAKTHVLSLQTHKTQLLAEKNKQVKEKGKSTEELKEKQQKELTKLMKKIKEKSTTLNEKKDSYEKKRQQIENDHIHKIATIKKSIQKVTQQQRLKEKEIAEEMQELAVHAEHLEEHYNSLGEEIKKLEEKINSMDNPMKEIITLEYKLKKKQKEQ